MVMQGTIQQAQHSKRSAKPLYQRRTHGQREKAAVAKWKPDNVPPTLARSLSLSLFFLFHLHKKLRGQDCQPASQQKDRRAKKTEQQSPGATNPWNRNKNASEQASCACPMYRQQIQAPMSQRPGNLRKFNDHTSLILARFLFAAANRLKAPVQPNSSDGASTVRNTPWLQSVKFTPVLSTGVLRASQFKNYTKSAKQTRFPVGP